MRDIQDTGNRNNIKLNKRAIFTVKTALHYINT